MTARTYEFTAYLTVSKTTVKESITIHSILPNFMSTIKHKITEYVDSMLLDNEKDNDINVLTIKRI